MTATATADAKQARGTHYAGFGGRVFRVEKAGKAGMFWACGRGRGALPTYLDKLGPRASREDMQRALDTVAARLGWREVQT